MRLERLLGLCFTFALAACGPGGGDGADAGADGGPDNQGKPATVVPYTPGATFQRFLDETARAGRGEPADLDGDGTEDTTHEDLGGGVLRTTFDLDEDGTPEGVRTTEADGSFTDEFDADQDGFVEWVSTFNASLHQRVDLQDLDFDDVLENRLTVTLDFGARTARRLVETDPDGDGTFSVVSDTTGPFDVAQGEGTCEPFPSDEGGTWQSLGGLQVLTGGGAGQCSPAQGKRLFDALERSMDEGLHCLLATNRALGLQLAMAFARGEDLDIACGDSKPGRDACTTRYSYFFDSTLDFNPSNLDAMSEGDLNTVMLHELLHWLGHGLGDPGHNDGEDKVYSCGRYCGGCTSRGPNMPVSSNTDCARCADTSTAKANCGTQRLEQDGECPTLGLCHKGFDNVSCTTCKDVIDAYCDDSPMKGATPQFLCCASCPTMDHSNDFPCTGSGGSLDSCGQPPPFCN